MVIKIATAFNRDKSKITAFGVDVDGDINVHDVHRNGIYIKLIKERKHILQSILNSDTPVMINDYRAHCNLLQCGDPSNVYDVSNYDTVPDNNVEILRALNNYPPVEEWMKLLAKASWAYSKVDLNGIIIDGYNTTLKHSFDTYSGRSKTHGTTKRDKIEHPNYPLLMYFDWVAADMQMLTYRSKDRLLSEQFAESDPYTWLAGRLDLSRDKCKIYTLSTIYGHRYNDAIFELYNQLKDYMLSMDDEYASNGYLKSVMDRKFGGDINAVFNASIQGSVAHAMQSAMADVYNLVGDRLLFEEYDGLVIGVDDSDKTVGIQNEVLKIMQHPLMKYGIDMKFVVRIKVGTWGNWSWQTIVR